MLGGLLGRLVEREASARLHVAETSRPHASHGGALNDRTVASYSEPPMRGSLRTTGRRPVVAVFAITCVLGASSSVAAQAAPCLLADEGATPGDQAYCWLDMHRGGDPSCASTMPSCLEQAALWCDRAGLDDQQVANTCAMARILTRRFVQAATALQAVRSPWPEVARCQRAFQDPLPFEVTGPHGATVSVSGRSIGEAPIDGQLPQPWYEQRIVVRQPGYEAAMISPTDHFATTSCTMESIAAQLESTTAPPTGQEQRRVVDRPMGRDEPSSTGELQRLAGWLALGTGTALGVVGVVALGLREGHLADYNDDARCARIEGVSREYECPDDLSAYETANTWMWIGLIGAGALAAGGTVLLLSAPSRGEHRSDVGLCSPLLGGVSCRWRF